MDEESLEVVKASAEGLAEGTARAFLETLFGAGVEAGEYLRDAVRYRRWRYQVKLLMKTRRFLEDQGIEPQAVPLKVLIPLLDYASLEEDDDESMSDRWAALLANAAAGDDGPARVLPGFPRILGELSAQDAALLDRIRGARDSRLLILPPRGEADSSDFVDRTWEAAWDEAMHLRVENLVQHGLLTVTTVHGEPPTKYWPTDWRGLVVSLTVFGRGFVDACQPSNSG
jgi:hypothetical protein